MEHALTLMARPAHSSPTREPLPASAADDETRYRAVLARDAREDGRFWYSVRTTGVFCRPSCASRRPRRENVAFHASIEDAVSAGFRPCRRCRPTEPPLAVRQAQAVTQACRMIEEAEDHLDLDAVAAKLSMSRSHFQRVFRAVTGLSPKVWAREHRAARVREELRAAASVTDALYAAGFNSNSRFYENADRMLGMKPSAFRDGAPALRVHFAIAPCSLGRVLVAKSDRGVCAILFGDSDRALEADLIRRFPKADVAPGGREFARWIAAVVRFVEAPARGLDLPLDIRGTAFQRRVWAALRRLPMGATASYAEIARRIGAPRSARAVAQACAANRLAVAIPCHRVVRGDGDLSGYRWGVERKRSLLALEARAAAKQG